MTSMEREALRRLVETVAKQLPRPAQRPDDDGQIEAEHQAQSTARSNGNGPSPAG